MRYVGIDYHKRYSVLGATDERSEESETSRAHQGTLTDYGF
jgi:hypothetical protein